MAVTTSEPQSPPPGWYLVDPHTERGWDGAAWGPQMRPRAMVMPHAQQPMPMSMSMQQPIRGSSVTTSPVQTSHTFHLLMTVFTCGLWGLVWLAMIIVNKLSRQRSVTRPR